MSNVLAITYEDSVPVTQSDGTDDPAGPFAGFFTGSGGTVKVTTQRGSTRTLTNLPAGVIMPMVIVRVWSTTTTATGVLGMHASPYMGPRV